MDTQYETGYNKSEGDAGATQHPLRSTETANRLTAEQDRQDQSESFRNRQDQGGDPRCANSMSPMVSMHGAITSFLHRLKGDRATGRPSPINSITPVPYFVGVLFLAALATALFCVSLSAAATLLLNRFGIDPFLTAEQCAGGFVVALVLVVSPGVRGAIHKGAEWAWCSLQPPTVGPAQVSKSGWALLGALRFVLACSVVIGHSFFWYSGRHLSLLEHFGGQSAVLAFFVISGFSIASTVTAHSTAQYVVRRAKRIGPLYYASFVFSFVPFLVYGLSYHTPAVRIAFPPISAIVSTSLFLQTWTCVTPQQCGPLWSLGCEAFYYMLAPILRKASTMVLFGLMVTSATADLAMRHHFGLMLQYQKMAGGITPFCLAWAWLLGFLLHRQPRWNVLRIASMATWPVAGVYIVATWVILELGPKVTLKAAIINRANYAGELSYPIYTTHLPVMLLFAASAINHNIIWYAPVVWVSCFGIAAVLYHGIDQRFRKSSKDASVPASKQTSLPGSALKAPS